jgi:hypothetical protein
VIRTQVNGKPATVAFLDVDPEGGFRSVPQDKAHLIKVLFDDGEMVMLRPQRKEKFDAESAKTQPHDELGRWASEGDTAWQHPKPAETFAGHDVSDQPRDEHNQKWVKGAGIEDISRVGEQRRPALADKLPWPYPKFTPKTVQAVPRFTDLKDSKKLPEREAPMAGYEHEGGPTFTDIVATAPGGVEEWEDRHIDETQEHFFAVMPDGKQINIETGDEQRVRFTDEQVRSMKDAVGTHNHPLGGWAFSPQDIDAAIAMNLSEMRCVGRGIAGEKITYSITRPPNGWPTLKELWNAASDYDYEFKEGLLRDALAGRREGQTDPRWHLNEDSARDATTHGMTPLQYADLNFRYFHEKNQWISDKLHLNYKRTVQR